MARNNRRQFVWARSAGATGPGLTPAVFGVDLLVGTRERYGDAVLRGATVMGVKGYIRPNVPSDTINYISCRAAIRVGTAGEVDDEPVNVRELGPWFSPEDDWMLFQQSLFITSASAAEGALPAEPPPITSEATCGLSRPGPTGSSRSSVGRCCSSQTWPTQWAPPGTRASLTMT